MLCIIGPTLNLYCAELFASQARRTSEVEIDQHRSYGWPILLLFFLLENMVFSLLVFSVIYNCNRVKPLPAVPII